MKTSILALLAPLMLASVPAAAQVTFAPAPDATILMGSDIFEAGQSNNVGPLFQQVLGNHWVEGACPIGTGSTMYDKCDNIRFGTSIYPDKTCTESMSVLVTAQEDGGKYVEERIKGIHNEGGTTWCDDRKLYPHDYALAQHRDLTLPGGTTATDVELDQFWERPRLTLMMIGGLPQTNNNTFGTRTIDSLREACTNYEGAGGVLPSMPTWTFVTRKFDDAAVPYAGLLAAAGGTGSCCYGSSTCDPSADAINVCDHIEDGRDDNKIRTDILNGLYNCGADGTTHGTGSLNFGDAKKGTLPEMRCLLVGESGGNNCDPDKKPPTDLLGIFSCVRQLPRGVSADDANILYCPDADPSSCGPIEDFGGSIEWIDDNKTLFLVTGVACDMIGVSTCEPNVPCVVDGASGRCALGLTDCSTGSEVCVSELDPMPEICNGLDDDCDGSIDNMVDSWAKSEFSGLSVPRAYVGVECNVQDVCVCPNGATDLHAGETFASYLAEWDPICQCGEGLAPSESSGEPAPMETSEPQAACSAIASRESALGGSFLALMLAGVLGFRRRR